MMGWWYWLVASTPDPSPQRRRGAQSLFIGLDVGFACDHGVSNELQQNSLSPEKGIRGFAENPGGSTEAKPTYTRLRAKGWGEGLAVDARKPFVIHGRTHFSREEPMPLLFTNSSRSSARISTRGAN
jgi:hypothetical protein